MLSIKYAPNYSIRFKLEHTYRAVLLDWFSIYYSWHNIHSNWYNNLELEMLWYIDITTNLSTISIVFKIKLTFFLALLCMVYVWPLHISLQFRIYVLYLSIIYPYYGYPKSNLHRYQRLQKSNKKYNCFIRIRHWLKNHIFSFD